MASSCRVKTVDDVEALRTRRPVAGGHVRAEIERRFRRRAKETANFDQLGRRNNDRPVTNVEGDLLNAPWNGGLQRRNKGWNLRTGLGADRSDDGGAGLCHAQRRLGGSAPQGRRAAAGGAADTPLLVSRYGTLPFERFSSTSLAGVSPAAFGSLGRQSSASRARLPSGYASRSQESQEDDHFNQTEQRQLVNDDRPRKHEYGLNAKITNSIQQGNTDAVSIRRRSSARYRTHTARA